MWGKHAAASPAAEPSTAERVAAAQSAELVALLERPQQAGTQILRSYLEGSSWAESFEQWCAPHAPLFTR